MTLADRSNYPEAVILETLTGKRKNGKIKCNARRRTTFYSCSTWCIRRDDVRQILNHALGKKRYQQQRDQIDHLDHRIDGGARRVFIGIAHGITGNGGVVGR